ncbi:galactocerebrosidase-like [Haliotis rufescens]|uniref:galactocerebrosidase-like n=1 Tax=Haliotis rufescens TaxID=6454 RepID=UPI00201F5537|nr:galactocerebrosidase-like [Haliotis rufescens]
MFTLAVSFSVVLSVLSDSYVIDNTGGLGRQFDGFGAISGGGATSKLLVNYPEKLRNDILDLLFKPNYGASLDILKVEIGSDAQSSDGTEATHMRTAKDENYTRGYEWWLMKEAKQRNPSIKLYGLPWGWPGWVGWNLYDTPDQTATYIVNWVLGANTTHGLHIDYVGIWNERMYNVTYIKTLRKTLDRHGLVDTHIIAPDNFHWDIAEDILADSELAQAVYAIGSHYPKTTSTPTAVKTGKRLWASEDQTLVNWNRNYVHGNMTGTIAWPLIASYYQGLPYYPDGLMTASEPWSGYYPKPKTIWVAAHTTQFAQPGWTYLRHGAGVGTFKYGGTYVTLVSPEGNDVTIIIETMMDDQDAGLPQNVTFQLKGTLASKSQFNVWYTNTQTDEYFIKKPLMQTVDGQLNLALGVNEMYTLTTLTSGNKGAYTQPPPSKPFPLPYMEDFESYEVGEEPFLFSQQIGAFEVVKADADHGNVMRQETTQRPVSWCTADWTDRPVTIIGDITWTDIYLEVDFRVPAVSGVPDGVFIASRLSAGGCDTTLAFGAIVYLDVKHQTFHLAANFLFSQVITEGNFTYAAGWNTASLLVKGLAATVTVNGKPLFRDVSIPSGIRAGFVGLGTRGYGQADFDNVKITSAKDGLHRMEKMKSRFNSLLP